MTPASTKELSVILSVTPDTVRNYVAEGMPIITKGGQGRGNGAKYDIKDCVKWVKDRAVNALMGDKSLVSVEEAKRRKAIADAELQEIALAKERGEVVNVGDIQREWSDQMIELRTAMRRIPERCVLRLVGEMDESKIKKVVLGEVDDALLRIIGE